MTVLCSLKIRTPTFKLQLEGNADFVRSSYEAIRREVLIHLGYTLTRPMSAVSARDAHPSAENQSHSVASNSEPGAEQYVWVYHCSDLYNKVHVAQRCLLEKTGLSAHLHPWRLDRIYLEGGYT